MPPATLACRNDKTTWAWSKRRKSRRYSEVPLSWGLWLHPLWEHLYSLQQRACRCVHVGYCNAWCGIYGDRRVLEAVQAGYLSAYVCCSLDWIAVQRCSVLIVLVCVVCDVICVRASTVAWFDECVLARTILFRSQQEFDVLPSHSHQPHSGWMVVTCYFCCYGTP